MRLVIVLAALSAMLVASNAFAQTCLRPEWTHCEEFPNGGRHTGIAVDKSKLEIAVPPGVARNFQAALHAELRERGVVAAFSRLHPLLDQGDLLAGLGETPAVSQTVSIDLTAPPEVQRARYRKNHKEGVNRLRRAGYTCAHDPDFRYRPEPGREWFGSAAEPSGPEPAYSTPYPGRGSPSPAFPGGKALGSPPSQGLPAVATDRRSEGGRSCRRCCPPGTSTTLRTAARSPRHSG